MCTLFKFILTPYSIHIQVLLLLLLYYYYYYLAKTMFCLTNLTFVMLLSDILIKILSYIY